MSGAEEFLVVHWQSGVENVHRSMLADIRRPTDDEARVAREAGLSPLKSLEVLESLERIELLSAERRRTIGSP